jgi:branched-chain amino acid transport system permease protein
VRMMAKSYGDLIIGFVACVVFLCIVLWLANPTFTDFVMRLAIFGLLAMSLNLLVGYAGLVSFGHAMFFGLGAYAFGLLMQSGKVSVPVAFLLTLGITTLWGVLVGALCIRLNEIYFSFLTIAFQMLLYSTIIAWQSLTGGDQGLLGGIPKPEFWGIDLSKKYQLVATTIIVVGICLLLLRQIVQSPFGYALRMVRDNPERARFLGLPVRLYMLAAFVIGGLFAAVAGALMSLYMSGAYPEFAFWLMSGEAIMMIMLGGIHVFLGPLFGAALFLWLNDTITKFTDYHGVLIGIILLAIVLGLRNGLLDVAFQWYADRRAGRLKTERPTSQTI